MAEDKSNRESMDEHLFQRVQQTVREIKRVELFATLTEMATVGLAFFLLGILLDHWVWSHGLPTVGRITFVAVTAIVLFVIFVTRLYPLVRFRINPLFAVRVLEDYRADHRNFLVNWFLLRHQDREDSEDNPQDSKQTKLHPIVLDGVIRQAAGEVAALPDETVVDHSSIIRWGILFVVVFTLFSVYAVVSVKNPFVSAQRLAMPWSKIEAPISVRFVEILPGDATFFVGQSVPVEAEIKGVRSKPVFFVWSTRDRRLIDQQLPMTHTQGNRYAVAFPEDKLGIQEAIDYRIVVGSGERQESHSSEYRLEVRQPPALTVEKVQLHFPEYTGIPDAVLENSGDISAPYGTKIKLFVRANTPMKNAVFMPHGKENGARIMNIDSASPMSASWSFTLLPEDENIVDEPTFRQNDFYVLTCVDTEDNPCPAPPSHRIDVQLDQPPTLSWEAAPSGRVELPLNHPLNVRVRAEDPDFGLASVSLHVIPRAQQPDAKSTALALDIVCKPIQLFPKDANSPHVQKGEIVLSGSIVPEKLGLVPGVEYEFWASASDAMTPKPHSTVTSRKLFFVTERSNQPPKTEEKTSDSQDKDKKSEQGNDSSEKQGKEGGQGDSSGEKQKGQGEKSGNSDQGKESEQKGDQGQEEGKSGENNDGSEGQQGASKEDNSSSGDSSGKDSSGSSQKKDDSNQNGAQDGKSGENGQGENSQGENGQGKNGQNENNPSEKKSDSTGSDSSSGTSDSQSKEGNQGKGNTPSPSASNDNNQNPSENEKQPSPENQGGNNANSSAGDKDSNPNNAKNGQGNTNGEGKANEKPSPIDPNANPGDAFEKIMDHMKEQGKPLPNEGNAAGNPAKEKESEKGEGAGSGDEHDPTKNPEKNPVENATPSSTSSNGKPSKSDQKIDQLPEDLGKNKQNIENGKKFEGTPPDSLPEGLNRKQGEVDPNTNLFMAEDTKQQDLKNAKDLTDPNAHVVDDPDRAVQGEKTTADANTRESKTKRPESLGDQPEIVPQSEKSDKPSERKNNESVNAEDLNLDPKKIADAQKNQATNPNAGQLKVQNGENTESGSASDQDPKGKTDDSGKNGGGANDQNRTPGKTESQQGTGGLGLGDFHQETVAAPADDPNIQYTEQATNLILEYLEDQVKEGIDRQLLEKLGWTEQQMKDFLAKWKEMKKNAKKSTATKKDRVDYLESLRNIGLRDPRQTHMTQGGKLQDTPENRVNTEATRYEPPASYKERFRAFNRGISREN